MQKKSTGSSQQGKLVRMNADGMRKPLTKAQKQELDALLAKPDSEIDLSDIPETVGTLYKPVKRAVSLRIDADVLVWLKSKGSGHLSRINGILREQMMSETKR